MTLIHALTLMALTAFMGALGEDLGCNIASSDWTAIYTALKERYYYKPLIASGLCNHTLPDSLMSKYESCNKNLEDMLSEQGLESNCRSFLQGIMYNGEGVIANEETNQLIPRTLEICTKAPFRIIIRDFICSPLRTVGCPRPQEIIRFSVFERCHNGALLNKTREEQAEYFATNQDKICMIRNNVCKDLFEWTTCPVVVQEIFQFIDESQTYRCDNMFPTVEERCQLTYKENNEQYCPPPTELEKNFYTIVVTCTVGPVFILALFIFYKKMYRAHHISSDEVLKQAQVIDNGSGESIKLYHPELAAIVESKYKGVSFNPATGEWSVAGQKEKFQDEQAAARFAYINLVGLPGNTANSSHTSYSTPRSNIVSNDFPVAAYNQSETEYVVTATPLTPEQIKARRLQQLISFYEFWEPSKSDIPAHAENLLNRHDFEHVARAVKTKYGVLPPGWAEELEV